MSSFHQNMMYKVLGDGARSTRFECQLSFSNLPFKDDELNYLIKATSFPTMAHETIDFRFRGRSVPIKGATKFGQTWTCTFYLDPNHKLIEFFYKQIQGLDEKFTFDDNMDISDTELSSIYIFQKNFENTETTAVYELKNAFATEISPVELSSDSVGTVLEVTVTFTYSHFSVYQVKNDGNGNFIENIEAKVKKAISDKINEWKGTTSSFIEGKIPSDLTSKLQSGTESIVSSGVDTVIGGIEEMYDSILDYVTPQKGPKFDYTKTQLPLSENINYVQALSDYNNGFTSVKPNPSDYFEER